MDVACFSLALKLFPKLSIPDPFVLVVATYHGLNFKVRYFYTTCIRAWFILNRLATKFLPEPTKFLTSMKILPPPPPKKRYLVINNLPTPKRLIIFWFNCRLLKDYYSPKPSVVV